MGRTVVFTLAGMIFEYDEEKNQINLEKHKISLKAAARARTSEWNISGGYSSYLSPYSDKLRKGTLLWSIYLSLQQNRLMN